MKLLAIGTIREIRREDFQSGDIAGDPSCLIWAEQIRSYLRSVVGKKIFVQISSYVRGGNYFAVDIFDQQKENSISITMLLCQKGMVLTVPHGHQIDIAIPNIVDAFSLVRFLLTDEIEFKLEEPIRFFLEDRQVA